jgi:hypothetical protein
MKYGWTMTMVLALVGTLVWAQATAIWNFSFIEVTSRKYVTRLSNREHLGGLADAAKELLQKQQQDNPVLVAAAKVVIDVHDNLLPVYLADSFLTSPSQFLLSHSFHALQLLFNIVS